MDISLQKVGRLIKKSEFKQAQNALIPLKNAYSYYPPIQAMDVKLGKEWSKWEGKVKVAVGKMRTTYERRDFKEALDLIARTRKSLKLLPATLKTLAEAEAYCKKMEARKEKARQLVNSAEAKLNNNNYNGALKEIKEAFRVSANLWNIYKDPTPRRMEKIQAEALAMKKKRESGKAAVAQPSTPKSVVEFSSGGGSAKQAGTGKPKVAKPVSGVVEGGSSSTTPVGSSSGNNSLRLRKGVFAPNEEIRLKFQSDPRLRSNTWVGLIPSATPHGSTARNDKSDIGYQFVQKRASGEMVFRAPAAAGSYDFRMSETTNDKEVVSVSFRVRGK